MARASRSATRFKNQHQNAPKKNLTRYSIIYIIYYISSIWNSTHTVAEHATPEHATHPPAPRNKYGSTSTAIACSGKGTAPMSFPLHLWHTHHDRMYGMLLIELYVYAARHCFSSKACTSVVQSQQFPILDNFKLCQLVYRGKRNFDKTSTRTSYSSTLRGRYRGSTGSTTRTGRIYLQYSKLNPSCDK